MIFTEAALEKMPRLADWDYYTTKGAILDMTNNGPLSPEKFPDTMTLYSPDITRKSIGHYVDEVWQETEVDPERKERGRSFVVLIDHRNTLITQPIRTGERTSISLDPQLRIRREINRGLGTTEIIGIDKVAISAHSHGIQDSPPSTADLVRLLVDNRDRINIGEMCAVVITKSLIFVLFRTTETPLMYFNNAVTYMQQEYEEYQKQIHRDGASVEEQHQLQMALLLKQCQELSLALFTGLRTEKVLRRVKF